MERGMGEVLFSFFFFSYLKNIIDNVYNQLHFQVVSVLFVFSRSLTFFSFSEAWVSLDCDGVLESSDSG